MAEIKLNEGFKAEVEAFRASGKAFETGSVNQISLDGISLNTVNAYHECLGNICLMLELFKYLVAKDANDMDELAESLNAVDSGNGNFSAGSGSGVPSGNDGGGGSW